MPEPSPGSVTLWIGELREGDADALRKLWGRYFNSLVRVAATKLRGAPHGVADEEDVALSVFDSVFHRASQGRFADIGDRDDLWRVLVVLVRQKSIDHRRMQGRQKRGGGRVVSVGSLHGNAHDDSGEGLVDFLGSEPRPDEIASMREELEVLLQCLPDPATRAIAVGKLEGCTNEELSRQLGVVPRTVERKLQIIRNLWLGRLAT